MAVVLFSSKRMRACFKLNISLGTVLPAPYGKGNKTLCDFTRTREIVRYRATSTLQRPQIKQNTVSNEGRGVTKPTGTSKHSEKVCSDAPDGRF